MGVIAGIAGVLVVGLAPRDSYGAADCFLKIDGVKGDSKDADHRDQISVESWSWKVTNPIDVTSGQRTGRRQLKEFVFTVPMSKADPKILELLYMGTQIKEAVFACRKAGRAASGHGPSSDAFTIKFTKPILQGYQMTGTVVDDPNSELSIVFEKMELDYKGDATDKEKTSVTIQWSASQ
jgi:type VI secretion system secreted protein Hcp